MDTLSAQGISNAYHITTATIHAEYFMARAKVAQVGQILEYPHNKLSMEDNIRVLVLCVNDFLPTEFTTLKKFQRTFRGDIVFSLYTPVQFVTVQLTAKSNEALREVCHTDDQKEVWRFSSYKSTVRKGSIRVAQVKTARTRWRASFINHQPLTYTDCVCCIERSTTA